MLEQTPAQGQPQGGSVADQVKALVRVLGPAAAVAAGVILAKGAGGREIGNIIKRLAPSHFEKLNASKIPYLIEEGPTSWQPKNGTSFFTLLSKFQRHLSPELLDTFEGIKRHTGEMPSALGHISVYNSPRMLGSSLHEFGHAVGAQRGLEQFPNANLDAIHNAFSGHLDQFANPKVHEMVKRSLERSPYLKGYYATRLQQGHQIGYGELLNEAWAEQLQRKAGLTPNPITQLPLWAATQPFLPELERVHRPTIQEAVRFGRLPAGDQSHSIMQLNAILRKLREAADYKR